jgi:hypothetical protein
MPAFGIQLQMLELISEMKVREAKIPSLLKEGRRMERGGK